jgi:hypothetical protein
VHSVKYNKDFLNLLIIGLDLPLQKILNFLSLLVPVLLGLFFRTHGVHEFRPTIFLTKIS